MEFINEDILYEDKDMIVCRKRAGMAVQTARLGEADMETALKNYLKAPYIAVIHRLDQPVEGILVFAKTKNAASSLSRQSRERMMNKFYYAVVAVEKSVSVGEECVLVDYLCRNGKDNISRVERADKKDAKRAELSYKIINMTGTAGREGEERTALVRVELRTGRHHQIRVQLAHAGMPILGDAKYGSEKSRDYSSRNYIKNIGLCAYGMEFIHPVTGKGMEFQISPSGEAFAPFFQLIPKENRDV